VAGDGDAAFRRMQRHLGTTARWRKKLAEPQLPSPKRNIRKAATPKPAPMSGTVDVAACEAKRHKAKSQGVHFVSSSSSDGAWELPQEFRQMQQTARRFHARARRAGRGAAAA